jgi:hypothetical protein
VPVKHAVLVRRLRSQIRHCAEPESRQAESSLQIAGNYVEHSTAGLFIASDLR